MTEKNPAEIIKKSFLISFALLFCIIIAYQSIIFIQTWTENNNIHKVNIAEQQSMLSQKIGKNLLLLLSMENTPQRASLINGIPQDIKLLKQNQLILEKADDIAFIFHPNKKIDDQFSASHLPLKNMLNAIDTVQKIGDNLQFDETKKNILQQAVMLYLENEKKFLPIMDDVVTLYEEEMRYYAMQLKWLSWLGAVTILAVIFVNGRFVVYKAIFAVEKQFFELKNNKEFQETILASSLEGIVSINHLGCITLLNVTAEKLFNQQQEEVLGKRISILLPEFNLATVEDVSHYYELELEGRRKGGEVFPILINISKLNSADQQGWVIFIKDLTLKKKRDLELMKAKQSVIDAVDANNAKSQFLANMSHELKTPLNSIIGFAQLLQTDETIRVNPELVEYISHIHDAGSHLLSIINEILDLATLESGKLSLSLEIVNFSKIVKESLILVQTLASKKHIKIYNQFAEIEDIFIIADRVRVKQVLLNLLSNGIKYNHNNGKIEVTMTIAEEYLRVNVIDDGQGIPEYKLASLFEPFNRLGAENSEIEGTGIGLTITKSLVEDMHGRIGVISEKDHGSTFWVEFPLAIQQELKITNGNSATHLEVFVTA